eukprot:1918273-Alexandrium_andersonii.AAC.1
MLEFASTKGAPMRAGSRLETATSPSGAPGQFDTQGLSTSTGFHFCFSGSSEGRSSRISGPEASE